MPATSFRRSPLALRRLADDVDARAVGDLRFKGIGGCSK